MLPSKPSEWSRTLKVIQTHLEAYETYKRSLDPTEKARDRVIAMLSGDHVCPICIIPVDYHITLNFMTLCGFESSKAPEELKPYIEACQRTGQKLGNAGIYNLNICIPCCMEYFDLLKAYDNPRFGKLHRPIHAKLHQMKNDYFPGFTQRASK